MVHLWMAAGDQLLALDSGQPWIRLEPILCPEDTLIYHLVI